MRNRKSIDLGASLITAAALLALALTWSGGSPPVNRRLHAALGQSLGAEAVRLAGTGGQVTIVTRDTELFPQPALDLLLRSFKRTLRQAHVSIAATHLLQIDPIRPAEVPSGDFAELLRRAPANHVIVSLLGPPLLSAEQRAKLPERKAKVVAFCPGNLGASLNLEALFRDGLLQAAIVSQGVTDGAGRTAKGATELPQLYRTGRAEDAASQTATEAIRGAD